MGFSLEWLLLLRILPAAGVGLAACWATGLWGTWSGGALAGGAYLLATAAAGVLPREEIAAIARRFLPPARPALPSS